jgi:hypothetical protein
LPEAVIRPRAGDVPANWSDLLNQGAAQQLANHKVSTWRAGSLRVPCAVVDKLVRHPPLFLACAAGSAPKLVAGARAYPQQLKQQLLGVA